MLGILRRNLSDCNIKVRAATYITIVRAVLEYAACAYDPYLQKDIQHLEQVQRRAARFRFKNYRDRTPGCVKVSPDITLCG